MTVTAFDLDVLAMSAIWGFIGALIRPSIKGPRYMAVFLTYIVSFITSANMALIRDADNPNIDLSWIPAYWPILLLTSALVYSIVFYISSDE